MIIQPTDLPWLRQEVQSIMSTQVGAAASMAQMNSQSLVDTKIAEVMVKIDEINDKLMQLEDYIDDQLGLRVDKSTEDVVE